MTGGAGGRPWVNDYGDIPRWYWVPRHVLVRQAWNDPKRHRAGRGPLLAMLAVSLGVPW